MTDETVINGPRTGIHPAKSFRKIKTTKLEQFNGFEMYVAVWNNRGRGEVMLGAPTLELLEERWEQITHSDFEPSRAQRVVVAYAAEFQLENWR